MRNRNPVDIEMGLSYFRMSDGEMQAARDSMASWQLPINRLAGARRFVKETAPKMLMQLAARARFFGFKEEAHTLLRQSDALAFVRDPFGLQALEDVRSTIEAMATLYMFMLQAGALKNEAHWEADVAFDIDVHSLMLRDAYHFLCGLHGVDPLEDPLAFQHVESTPESLAMGERFSEQLARMQANLYEAHESH